MPIVSGTLTDIGLAPLAGANPVLRFTPSAPAVDGSGRVFASRPVEVTPASNGSFSVELASTAGLLPTGTHWRISFGFHSTADDGSPVHWTDYLPLQLFVTADGSISDLIGSYTPNDFVYVGADVPNPAMSAYQFQFNPVTGDLYGRQG